MTKTLISLGLLSLFAAPTLEAAPGGTPPNIVLILADDFGVNMVGAYGEAPTPPCTPTLNQLAADGLLFRNAYTSPSCAPSRAQTMTGRHGFRNGIGMVGMGAALDLAEVTIPEMLTGYSSAALGKWGLAGNGGGMAVLNNPNNQGFDYFAGGIGSGIPDYFSWNKVTNGSSANTTTYATTDTADEAIFQAQTLPQPFFLYVNFHSPHTPIHTPPAGLCPSGGSCTTSYCTSGAGGQANRIKAMAEAMDTELGRMLTAIQAVDPNAMIIFMGDNGTANQATEAPFVNGRAKGTVYEGGINVPLIVKGPGVVVGETAGLVSSVDLAATITELAGLSTTAEDSVSMVPYFSNPSLALRSTVYSEEFTPNNNTGPLTIHNRAIRNDQYKLILRLDGTEELFDLIADPFEGTNLMLTLVDGSEAQVNYFALIQALESLGVANGEDFTSFCNGDGGDQLGCTNCPCANNAPAGTIGGCLNSVGTGARLTASGNTSVSMPSGSTTDLRFGVCNLPPGAFAILNSGDAVGNQNMASPCFGLNSGTQAMQFDGLRCAITNTRRHGGRSADAYGDVGITNGPWGGDGNPALGIAQAGTGFLSGQTRFFQVIHRDDVALGCMRGLNTSQAIEVTFGP